jgi:uncharacterized protein YndB with AHSA1/START domain
MSREFRLEKEVELDAGPDQVWEAIATGPGISSWFMGPHEVEPRLGGHITLTIGEFKDQSTITAWDPPRHLAYRGDAAADGSFHAIEYVIESQPGGRTRLRFVHSGFVSDDWGPEFVDQTAHGWTMYLHTLGLYLCHFTGRPGTYVYAQSPNAADGRDAWTLVMEGLGVRGLVAEGDRVRLTPDGLATIEGVVDYAPPVTGAFLGVRGEEGLYRFHGHGDNVAVGHHLFAAGIDGEAEGRAWQAWLTRVLAT